MAVFDVNHTYGGAYLVPTRRLWDAVNTVDITSKATRGVVVTTILHAQTQDQTTPAGSSIQVEMA